jgi:hypothetical protein
LTTGDKDYGVRPYTMHGHRKVDPPPALQSAFRVSPRSGQTRFFCGDKRVGALFALTRGLYLSVRGGAHSHYFSLLAQRKVAKRNGTPRFGLRYAPTCLRFSPFPARVNSWAAPTQICTRLPPETAAILGCTKGTGYSVVGSVRPGPVDAAEHHRTKPGEARTV